MTKLNAECKLQLTNEYLVPPNEYLALPNEYLVVPNEYLVKLNSLMRFYL